MKVVIAILAFTGMCVGELRELRWTDVLFDQGANGFIVSARCVSSFDRQLLVDVIRTLESLA